MQIAPKSCGSVKVLYPGSVETSKARLAQVQSWLKANRLGAALFSNAANIEYLTGFAPAGVDGNEAFLVIAPDQAALWTSPFYEAKAKRIAPHIEVHTGKQADFLRSELGGSESIGVEKGNLTWSFGERLQSLLPGAKFQEMDFAEKMRMVKTRGEEETVRKAIQAAGNAMRKAAGHARPGTTETKLAAVFREALIDQNASESFATIMAAGVHGAEPHYDEMDDAPLKKGTMIVMDVGARVHSGNGEPINQGYDSDLTRMIVIGKPSLEQKKILALVEKAQSAAIAMVAPGVPVREIDLAARKVIEEAGYGPRFIHATGHGIGKEVHEAPLVSTSAGKDEVLKPGEIITIEPGVYLPGKFGVRLEDMVLVTETGHEVMSKDLPKVFYRGQGLLAKMGESWEKLKKKFLTRGD